MNDIGPIFTSQLTVDSHGYYTTKSAAAEPTEANEFWSMMANENAIHAAAASKSNDPFAKYPQLIQAEIPDEPGLVLDAGCGYGRVAIPLLRNKPSIRLVGVDASPAMLRYFLELVSREDAADSIKSRLSLVHSNINVLPFKDKTFDHVFSSAVLLHNPYRDVEVILREFHRILRPEGKLVLVSSFPNVYNLEGLQNYIHLQRIDELNRNGPVRVYSKTRINRLFQEWSSTEISPTGAVLIPRQLGKLHLPFGNSIRSINSWIGKRGTWLIKKTSLMANHLDVVAVK